MSLMRHDAVLLVMLAVLLPLLLGRTFAKDRQTLLQQEIQEVRSKKHVSTARTEAAERIAQLTKKIPPNEVDDNTIADLVSLLDISDDSVRGWIAASIGNIGPRAKAAAPKLLKILAELDCNSVVGGLTSEGPIRMALKRIGTEPPPVKCGAHGQSKG